MKLHVLQLDPEAKSLSLKADIDFEQFELFAEPLVSAMDCRIIERQWGADRHQWLLDFEGCRVGLHYEFYGDICWLSVDNEQDVEVLTYLMTLLKPFVLASGDLQS